MCLNVCEKATTVIKEEEEDKYSSVSAFLPAGGATLGSDGQDGGGEERLTPDATNKHVRRREFKK